MVDCAPFDFERLICADTGEVKVIPPPVPIMFFCDCIIKSFVFAFILPLLPLLPAADPTLFFIPLPLFLFRPLLPLPLNPCPNCCNEGCDSDLCCDKDKFASDGPIKDSLCLRVIGGPTS